MSDIASSNGNTTDKTNGGNAGGQGKRRKLLVGILSVALLAAIAWGAYWALVLRWEESTDDAYVNGDVVQITSQVPGTVVKISANDTDFVKAGATLVQLDTADAKVALEQAEAGLAKTVRQVRNLFETSGQLQETVRQRETDVARARDDLKRREKLSASGAVSGEEIQHAKDQLSTAEAALGAAKRQLAAQHALVDRTTIDDHPDVKNAAARVREAYLAFARTTLPAPVSGYVAKRTVQLGQRINAGTALMAVVPLDDVWVDANFKEGQLRDMRVGQPVTLTADLYGGKLEYHGKVEGFGAGTGGAFALLPAQNASGNWIKIVQRVPVRIALDREELLKHPLQIGLSMQAKVDTHVRDGVRLPQVTPVKTADASAVFEALGPQADARVNAIIAANDGKSAGGVHRVAYAATPAR
ncbi:MAG TPA: efflux RND transporter periplasmic adaptor subunit [Usitatibacter sp.]|nr:efflux RND transporter periplasmic adaptor subunit [Usitatibacter sp.]